MSNDQRERARALIGTVVSKDDRARLGELPPGERSVRVDWQTIAGWEHETGAHDAPIITDRDDTDEYTLADVSGIARNTIEHPEATLDALNGALVDAGDPYPDKPLAQATVRVHNLPKAVQFTVGDFSPTSQRGRLIELEGQVTKRTFREPAIRTAAYECTGCGQVEMVPQPPFGKLRDPPGPCWDCKNERMSAWWLRKEDSEWADHQKLRLQQPPEHALGETKHVDVHLFGDLTGRGEVESGARIRLTGRLVEVYTGKVVFGKRVVGNAITPDEEVFDDNDLAAYEDAISEIKGDSERYRNLVASVAPSHQGDPLVKQALTVQAFTGGRWIGPDGTMHRGDSHVKLIGDPGTDKTGLLRALYHRVPVGAFVDGPGSSGVGLTAALTKDDFSSEQWSIEAGALVRASGGTALIDEFDKFDQSELGSLHTPLESQEVIVSKAGKRATLTAETAVVAAANPTGGHYDPTKEFAAQVDVQSPLLSRFDLIFVMREKINEDDVRRVARQMIQSRQRAARRERGELETNETDHGGVPYTAEAFRAYVAAASRLTPVIRDETVADAIEEWYAELKTTLPNRYRQAIEAEESNGQYPKRSPPLPVTARKVDAMQRLAAASARLRFSETVTMRDVERVRPFLKRSLADIGIAPSDNEAFGAIRSDLDPEEVGV